MLALFRKSNIIHFNCCKAFSGNITGASAVTACVGVVSRGAEAICLVCDASLGDEGLGDLTVSLLEDEGVDTSVSFLVFFCGEGVSVVGGCDIVVYWSNCTTRSQCYQTKTSYYGLIIGIRV